MTPYRYQNRSKTVDYSHIGYYLSTINLILIKLVDINIANYYNIGCTCYEFYKNYYINFFREPLIT